MAAGDRQQPKGSLDSLIRDAFWHLMTDVRVSMPGRVESFDTETRLGAILPMLQRRYLGDAQPTEFPVLQRVPIVEPRAGKAILSLPVESGDPCLLVFSDRAIDNWLGGAGTQPADVQDTRQHDLTDAFFIPGGWPELQPSTHAAPSGTAAELLVAPGTPIAIGNGDVELLQIAHDAFNSLKDAATELKNTLAAIQLLTVLSASPGNPSSVPVNVAVFLAIEATVDTIISAVGTEISDLEQIKV